MAGWGAVADEVEAATVGESAGDGDRSVGTQVSGGGSGAKAVEVLADDD